MNLTLDPNSIADYNRFLAVKALPKYSVVGRTVSFPDEYASRLGIVTADAATTAYEPHPAMFDYQRDINAMAVDKGCFSLFEDCGLGKTLQELDFIRHVARNLTGKQCVLLVAPLMVVRQTMQEAERFYGGDLKLQQVRAADLQDWLLHGTERIGITNYDALTDDLRPGRLAGLVLDESSMLKSHYGKWGQTCLRLGKGLRWKLAATGTPAPNDRIEYANHAVFMDAFPTINAFLARFFVNKGQTCERWMLKPHALEPFYRALSHWSIFLTNPATYGWKDNTASIPPIKVHIVDVPMTAEQRALVQGVTGRLLCDHAGGITSRGAMGQIAKGSYRGDDVATNKPAFIRRLVDQWPDESTLIWCGYNAEQDRLAATFPEAASISGDTPLEARLEMIDAFKAGTIRTLISKPKILGFGLNLQRATRQVFSWLQDSYEAYYQAVKRSNRYGSTKPLNVHIPITEIERPMAQTVLDKAKRVQADTEEQERIFKHARTA